MSKQICFLLLVSLLVLLPGIHVHAHRLILTIENNSFTVRYDDGTAANRAVIRILDEGERVLWEGSVSEGGTLELPVKNFAKVIADDGLGHRATYKPGQKTGIQLPRPLAAALGLSVFIFIASLGRFFTEKKRCAQKG